MESLKGAFILLSLLSLSAPISSYIEKPGPRFPPTKGEVWPKPQNQVKIGERMSFDPDDFEFKVSANTSPILEEAIKRYEMIFKLQAGGRRSSIRRQNRRKLHKKGERIPRQAELKLTSLYINMTEAAEEWPYLKMDESYSLNMESNFSTLSSASIWGILRGMETFSQLVYINDPLTKDLSINQTLIYDYPRFSHRGLLLDTCRHYVSVTNILKILDGMAYNKLNVFHWHIVDDQSFPYVSAKFPTLSEKGAYHPTLIYTPADVQRVIEYARLRGIRVMPEFDTPGHTRSWGVAYPELLTKCYTNGQPNGDLGPINPANEDVYTFMKDLMAEVVSVFPDKYVHLGGDEVDFDCWESNPEITAYMNANNISDYHKLEEVYIQRVVDMISELKSNPLVWQEVFLNGVNLPNGTVVQAWTGNQELLLYEITRKGLPALLSSCWYLDHLSNGGDWMKFYQCDPHNFPGNAQQKELVMGGEACMWAEVIDDNNVLTRIFPRVSATAEKLWSAEHVNDINEARFRMEEHYCRMNKRGIPAQPPSGPGYCV